MKKCPRCKINQEGIGECQFCGFAFDNDEITDSNPEDSKKKICLYF